MLINGCPVCHGKRTLIRKERIVIPAIRLRRQRNVRLWRGKKLVFRTYKTYPRPVQLSVSRETMDSIARLAA